jgi:Mrp family chromosome partitioning ATPase
MRRNLELLKQLEMEVDQSTPRAPRAGALIENHFSPIDATRLFGEETVQLVHTVFLSGGVRSARQVAFCGVEANNGSSSVCANSARALGLYGHSVCVVDADVRLQPVSSILGADRAAGYPNSASIRERCLQTDDNVWLADAALLVSEAGALLSITELRRRFEQLNNEFDYVLVDTPAIGRGPDATLIIEIVGAAILIVEANATRRQSARRAKESIEATGARLLGSVLRNRTFPIPEGLYKRL